MSHFYGSVSGQAGTATRTGSKCSGYHAWAQNRTGQVSVRIYNAGERDYAEVEIRGSSLNYLQGRLSLGVLDLSAMAEGADDPIVQRHVERARVALAKANARALKLAKVA